MKKLVILSVIFMSIFALHSCAQETETYWRIADIYREDQAPFIGLTAMSMEEIYDYNFHFVKRKDSLYFELPEKFMLDLKDFSSLGQLQITDKDYYEMYDHTFSSNSFIVKFKDNATSSASKNTIIAFEKIEKEEFEKDIDEAIAYQKAVAKKIDDLKDELKKQPPIVLNTVKKLPTKEEVIVDDTYEHDITLLIPEEIALRESGDIKNEQFGDIKIGTFKDHSRIYDIDHAEDYGLKQLTIWVSSDPAAFSMKKYVAETPNLVLVKSGENSIVGYKISYDFETDKAIIGSFFTLKYYTVGKSHLFIYADVYASQMKNAPNDEEMNKILNFNYSLSENISVILTPE